MKGKRASYRGPGNPQGYDENCVICQNEGMHNIDERPHVMEGQE